MGIEQVPSGNFDHKNFDEQLAEIRRRHAAKEKPVKRETDEEMIARLKKQLKESGQPSKQIEDEFLR